MKTICQLAKAEFRIRRRARHALKRLLSGKHNGKKLNDLQIDHYRGMIMMSKMANDHLKVELIARRVGLSPASGSEPGATSTHETTADK